MREWLLVSLLARQKSLDGYGCLGRARHEKQMPAVDDLELGVRDEMRQGSTVDER